MNGGDWSVLGLSGDPVRGEPGAVRTLGNASQQEARRWEDQVQSLRTIASEVGAMEMQGDFASVARELLQAHPNDATALARGRADAGAALLAYAQQLEQAKRESQTALSQGVQAKRTMDMAERTIRQLDAQMNAIVRAGPYPPTTYPYVMQQFNMLRAQQQQAIRAWDQAKAQWQAAQQRAIQAGERARQQERIAAEKVIAASPTRAAARRGGGGGGGGDRSAAVGAGAAAAGGAGGAVAAGGRGGGVGGGTGGRAASGSTGGPPGTPPGPPPASRVPSSGQVLVTTPRGTTYQIPQGWQPRPADNGKGIVYQNPKATHPNGDMIRIMEPTPQYPNGYVRYYNSHGQPIKMDGKPGSKAETHFHENGPEGYPKGWPS